MSPHRYRPSYEARPVFEGLPRTDIRTPATLVSTGITLFGLGLIMFGNQPLVGELGPRILSLYNGGRWAALILGAVLMGAAAIMRAFGSPTEQAAAPNASDLWKRDYDWSPGTARDRAGATAVEGFVWVAFSIILGSGALYFGFASPEREPAMSRIVSLFIAGTALACAWVSIDKVRRGVLFGESVLRWSGGGPLRAGTRWTGTVEVADLVSAPYAHLQLIKERRIELSESFSFKRYEHDRVKVTVRIEKDSGGRKILSLTADIPADAPTTMLSGVPAQYWELFVADDASGWATSFLVPVYS